MTLQEKRQRIGAIADELKTLTAAQKAESRRPTDDERATMTGRLAEADKLKAEIAAEEADLALIASADAFSASASQSPGRRTDTSAGAPQHKGEAAEADPKCGFKTEREYFTAVLHAAGSPHRVDKRLAPLATVGSDEHSTQDFGRGGFLIPSGFINQPLQLPVEADPTADRTRKVPMSAPIVRIPVRTDKNHQTSVSGGLTVSRTAETVAATSSRLTGEQLSLEAFDLFGLSFASERLLADSPGTFISMIQQGYRDEFGSQIFSEKLRGTGVGEYLGVLNSPCLVTITKESAQAANTLKFENVIKMRARCWRYGGAIWLANHETIPQLAGMVNGSTTAVPAFLPSAREDMPDMLLGRPIYFSEYASALSAAGDIILGNWGEYLEGNYQGLQEAESMHVRFVEHERAFKFWMRNCGMPWWRSALTPKKGTATISPFVTLEAR